ncbi:TetR/AcrR family transcriptional regulator [Microbacterium jejuense]|uniref:TetR/AcrR family transcriptional regulator n=1 Tax=Microbacterium jejuense TaxID=1263637 RepID=UPI0031E7258A
MPATLRTPRPRWIQAAADALSSGGPDAVRVEALAAALGVTKGSFYTHFAGRDELLTAVLDDWERRSVDDVRARVDARGGDAAERISRAGVRTFSDEILPLDLAVRDWARRDDDVRERLRRVDTARMEFLRTEFRTFISDPDEVEARAVLAFSFAIGRHFVAVADDASGAAAVARAGRLIVRQTGEAGQSGS